MCSRLFCYFYSRKYFIKITNGLTTTGSLLVKVEGSLNGRSGQMAKDFSLYWDIDSLNKAYQQGYMAGVMGMDNRDCPYTGEIVEAAWEAGWEDGIDVCELQRPEIKTA